MTKGILSLIRKLFIFISGMWEVGADDFRKKYNRKGYPQTTSGILGGCGELGRQRCLGTLLGLRRADPATSISNQQLLYIKYADPRLARQLRRSESLAALPMHNLLMPNPV